MIGFGPVKNHLGRIAFSENGGVTAIDYQINFDSRLPLLGPKIASDLASQWEKGIGPVIAELEARAGA